MSQLHEYRCVVPRYPPLCNLALLHAENCPKIKSHFPPRRREWPQLSPLGALVRCPYGHEVALGNEVRERLDGIRKDCRILPEEFLVLLTAPDVDPGVAWQWRTTSGANRSSKASH